jgi:membrane-associated phospholipid phosphatase
VRLAHPRSALLVCASAFVALACAALLMGVLPADATVYRALASIGSPAVRRVMHVVNYAGAWQVLLPGTLLLYAVFERARERWWIWLVLMVAAPLAEQLMKFSIARHRPEDPSYGFPSGHATASAAFFGAVIYLAGSLPPRRRRLVRVAAAAAIVLVGLARILLRAHWPSDVAGGIALGLALASGAALLASSEIAVGDSTATTSS